LSIKFSSLQLAGLILLACSLLSAQTSTSTAAAPASPQDPPASQQSAPPASSSTETSPQTSQAKEKDQSTANGKSQEKAAASSSSQSGTSNDRLFYTLPNFLTLENGGKLPPLTAKEKFKVVARSTFDPVQYPWWAILSALSQAENSEPAFGQGWAGYGKRYGTTAGDSLVENFMVGAVFPSILHQDPRFYQSSQGRFGHRALYAVTRIFVTRGDSGNRQFNFSEIFGAGFAGAVSTYTYHPKSTYISTPSNPHLFIPSERTLSNTASVWGTQIGLDSITLVVKEFWPDIHRKISHKHPGAVAATDKGSQ
jgi:hypothetical protein